VGRLSQIRKLKRFSKIKMKMPSLKNGSHPILLNIFSQMIEER